MICINCHYKDYSDWESAEMQHVRCPLCKAYVPALSWPLNRFDVQRLRVRLTQQHESVKDTLRQLDELTERILEC